MMAVFEVLSEVVGSEELLGLVALAKLVHVVEVVRANVPLWWVGKVFATIPAYIPVRAVGVCVEGCLDSRQHSTRPRMLSKV